MLKKSLAACALISTFFISACVDTPVIQEVKPLDYQSQTLHTLDIAEVLVVSDAAPSPISHGPTLEAAIKEWATKRVKAAGVAGSFSLIIRKASVSASPLPTTRGFAGKFKREQGEVWNGQMEVLFSIDGAVDENGKLLPSSQASVTAHASHTVPEEATEPEKQRIYSAILNSLMIQFNQQAETQLQTYFRQFFVE